MLVARAASGLEEEVEQGVRIPVGKGFAGRVASARAPVVIEDVDHADILNPILREKGIKSMLGVPLEVGDKLLGVLHVGSLTPRAFNDHDIAVLRRVARRVAIPVEQAALYGTERSARVQLESARGQLAFLAEASAVLGSSLDYETTLASVARLAVPALADWCVIDVVDDVGAVRRVASVCANPAHDELAEELRQSYPTRPERMEGTSKVLRTGRSELVEEIPPDWLEAIAPDDRQQQILRSLGLRSNILVPLIARGRTLGVLTLATAESERRYGQVDLRLAEELASRAALAVDNARLFREAEESLGLLDALFATAPVGLAFYDRNLRYLKINETLAALNGVPAEEHIGRTAGQVIPAIADKVEPLLRSVLESGEPVLGKELRGATAATPEERYWLASYYPVRSGDGEVIGVGAVVADLTERTRGQLRLAAQYEVTRILSVGRDLRRGGGAGPGGDVRQPRLVDRRDLDGLRRRHPAHARRLLRARGRPGQLRRRFSRPGPRGRLRSSGVRGQLRARHLGRGSARGRAFRSPGQRGGHRPAVRLRLPRLPRVDRVRRCRVLQHRAPAARRRPARDDGGAR